MKLNLQNRMRYQIWIIRLLIGVVAFFNLQCAVAFILWPDTFSGSLHLSGVPGGIMVQAMGVLFLMWNIPYVVALTDPVKKRTSLLEAVIMQAIGLAGECLLLATLPDGYPALRMTALRFIGFDGTGLIFLLLALWLSIRLIKLPEPIRQV